jgi:hypothetical protein
VSRAETDARYNSSEKGRARHERYNTSEKAPGLFMVAAGVAGIAIPCWILVLFEDRGSPSFHGFK